MASFGEQLNAFAEKTGERLEDVDRAFKISLFGRVVRRTRVADPLSWKRPDPTYLGGTMRGNWQISTGRPIAEFIEGRRNLTAVLPASETGKIQAFSSTWLSNNTPYARYYEEIDGMVGGAIADAKRALAEAVAQNVD